MSRSASPLRYPGGKACLFDLTVNFLRLNGLLQRKYAEPYSGGCGLALSLLFSGHVTSIHLNDLDRSVWAFWMSVLHQTEDLIHLIESTPLSVDEWRKQRDIQWRKADADVLELGFSTFFLNRTNRSGIIHSGGVIGGLNQNGKWKIDCRFNKPDLIKRIKRISLYRNRIKVYNEDAEKFMDQLENGIADDVVVYIDPPYYEKGSKLYRNAYRAADHERLSRRISRLDVPWFLTYDNIPEIRRLYADFPSAELDIGYSVQTKRRGSEILVASKYLRLPVTELASAR